MKFCQKQILIPSILKISEGELNNTGKYLKESLFNNAAIFFSEGIEEIFGKKLYDSLNSSGINIVHKSVISDIDIENVIHTAFEIPKSTDVLIGIGGGKALDYSKYCAHILALPFVSIPTSTSNDGFCSPNSSLLVQGKRKSVNAKIPYGVIVDIEAVKTSPESCIYSGIGDLISKITAGHDWKIAAEITGERFNDFAYIIANNTVSDILHYKKFSVISSEFLYHLVNSLLMNGISMEIAGFSRPASGSEHLISHAYDQIALKPSMHGIQVGIATYICSYLQGNQFETVKDFLKSTGFFDFAAKNPLCKRDFVEAIRIAPSVKEDFYTILSDKKNIEKALEFVENDEICRQVLI
ncbi:MAG TPA: iron-containing alcohol dehydrogenase family protein [Candidatus Gastranaerophilales bacterium]|nr:iron-containing alcohol dehydrogenase family protein [Candidatus Gastranaerophilales bacterium]